MTDAEKTKKLRKDVAPFAKSLFPFIELGHIEKQKVSRKNELSNLAALVLIEGDDYPYAVAVGRLGAEVEIRKLGFFGIDGIFANKLTSR